jgi:hypothetical protein
MLKATIGGRKHLIRRSQAGHRASRNLAAKKLENLSYTLNIPENN